MSFITFIKNKLNEKSIDFFKKNLPLSVINLIKYNQFGRINELYYWVCDEELNTVAPIQNYFSYLFPQHNTATNGSYTIFDNKGLILKTGTFKIQSFEIYNLNISELNLGKSTFGTFTWEIEIPTILIQRDDIIKKGIFFMDRGYIYYIKNNSRISYIHGVDRYLIYNKVDHNKNNYFYQRKTINRSWAPEIPLKYQAGETTKLILLNRSKYNSSVIVNLKDNIGNILETINAFVYSNGVEVVILDLSLLGSEYGFCEVLNISTPWGRPTILRSFSNGAFSIMHT